LFFNSVYERSLGFQSFPFVRLAKNAYLCAMRNFPQEKITESLSIETITSFDAPSFLVIHEVASFLHKHLDEYGDKMEDITACLEFALHKKAGTGGFVLVAKEHDQIMGVCVINTTSMSGYIPSNTLVYIATHASTRGKGIGSHLIKKAIQLCRGGIALHVEPDNPAKKLYEKLGFTNKYLEMRLEK
jgi:GNAT superfamily N-acetyltransferase